MNQSNSLFTHSIKDRLVSVMDPRKKEAEANSSMNILSEDTSDLLHMPQPRLKGYGRIKFKQKCFQR